MSDNVVFAVVFGVFIVALLVLSAITLTWAVRRDRAGRAAWVRRRTQPARTEPLKPLDASSPADPGTSAPATNGHRPVRRRGGQR
jgi:hypothetical protein